jgi:hypothetical protein
MQLDLANVMIRDNGYTMYLHLSNQAIPIGRDNNEVFGIRQDFFGLAVKLFIDESDGEIILELGLCRFLEGFEVWPLRVEEDILENLVAEFSWECDERRRARGDRLSR